MPLLTLYARREPTTDPVAIAYGLTDKRDVVLYRDAACTKPAARHSWHVGRPPRRGQRSVMHNCFRYVLAWA